MSTTNSVPPKQGKRLVLMFDGTGNTRSSLSNVARMFEAIDDSLPQSYVTYPTMGPDGPCFTCGQGKRLEPDQEPVQLVKYIKGVGTSFLGHFSGLGFGFGLSANVIEGYVWLSNHYCDGDEIFVFGFSRGAFSARSLVSLVHQCGGVLKNVSKYDQNEPELEVSDEAVVKAYAMYQAYVQTTDSEGTKKQDPALFEDFDNKDRAFKKITCGKIYEVKVKMLGVWDTVGALGIPQSGCKFIDDYLLWPLRRYSSKQYQFHGQGLSCIVQNAYHALALDEHRQHFEPTLWNQKTSKEQEVKQVWFTGSHCNVGGGADMDDFIDPDDLWQYSYVWMQRHAEKHDLRFYWSYNSPATQKMDRVQGKPMPSRRVSLRTQEDSFGLFLGGVYKWVCNPVDRDVKVTNGAKLHWSVKERIEQAKVHWSEKDDEPTCYRMIMSLFGRYKNDDRPGYYPTSLFGKSGTSFTSDGADIVIEKDGVKTVWQIETDNPEVHRVTSTRPQHSLHVTSCGCRSGDSPKEKGL